MKRITTLAAATAFFALTSASYATDYTWTGDAAATGNNIGSWDTVGNWSGDAGPTFDDVADIKIDGTQNLDLYIRQSKTIRSLEFTATNLGETAIGLRAANDAARNITFSADSGNSTLMVDASATGNKEIGRNLAGTVTGGDVVLVSNLDITNDGDGFLNFRGEIRGAGNITISGTDKTQFFGINTYTGNTTVNSGADLNLANLSGMAFTIGAAGVNNAILGTGTVANIKSDFAFDLTGASTTVDDSWTIVSMSTLTASFHGNFGINGFTEDANVWSGTANGADYEFSELTGVLTVVPEPGTYALLAGLTGLVYVMVRRRRA